MNIDKKFILSIEKEKELNMIIQGLEMLRQKHESISTMDLSIAHAPPSYLSRNFVHQSSPPSLISLDIITVTTNKYEVESALDFLKDFRYHLKNQE